MVSHKFNYLKPAATTSWKFLEDGTPHQMGTLDTEAFDTLKVPIAVRKDRLEIQISNDGAI